MTIVLSDSMNYIDYITLCADSDICRFKFRQMQVQSTELRKYKDEREQMQTDAASDKQQQIQTDNTADSDSSRFSGNSGFRQRDNITKI
ncbi:hypothetical protein Tco_1280140, partial [Tanacetum coccineum]